MKKFTDIEKIIYDKKIENYISMEDAVYWYKNEEGNRFLCPICKESLVFVDGKKMIKHFRHKSEQLCYDLDNKDDENKVKKIIEYCNESYLHKEFKNFFNVLKDNKGCISIPHFKISLNDYNDFNRELKKIETISSFEDDEYTKEFEKVKCRNEILIIDVKEEVIQGKKNEGNLIIPDLVVTCAISETENIEYNIEIVLHNDITEEKYKKIVKNKKNCIQFKINDMNITEDNLKKLLEIRSNKNQKNYLNLNHFNELKIYSRYIYTTEIDLENEYKNLYKQYKKNILLKYDKYLNNFKINEGNKKDNIKCYKLKEKRKLCRVMFIMYLLNRKKNFIFYYGREINEIFFKRGVDNEIYGVILSKKHIIHLKEKAFKEKEKLLNILSDIYKYDLESYINIESYIDLDILNNQKVEVFYNWL